MKVRTALLELFKGSREWRDFFRSCCQSSAFRLRAQSWQFRDEPDHRSNRFQVDEVEDALLELARELLPKSLAAQWDADWAHELCKDALAQLAKAYAGLSAEEKDALDLSSQAMWDERMCAAGEDNDPATFRATLKGWTRAGLEVMKHIQIKGGAA
jgi:hypothetical protein